MVEVFERISFDEEGRAAYHFVLIDFLCECMAGTATADDDVDEVAWVERNRISDYETTDGAPAVIEKAFAMRAGRAQGR
jgi:hypothetical protein